MLNIVIPMAGRGSRFSEVGYQKPKPLIPVDGVPMIRVVIENLRPSTPHRFIFICQRAHVEEFDLKARFAKWTENYEVIELDGVTEGAACTVLSARHLIDSDDPLMIANSDQYVDIDINDYLAALDDRGLDGLIMTMKANDPKWSFAELNDEQLVTRVAEKDPISEHATVGIYNFAHGRSFVEAADAMIAADERVNNEFYVAPVYNKFAQAGLKTGTYSVGTDGDGMYGLGTPADLEFFLTLPVAKQAVEASR